MFSRIHSKLGPAGFAVAIIALAAALGGTAFAASGLNGTQQKEVKKIAKKFAGKQGPVGPTGATGLAGAPGSGAIGPAGKNGTDGEDGADGKGVLTGSEASGTANCEGRGGVWVEVESSGLKRYVCNGEDGEGGAAGGTETGLWSFTAKGPSGALMTISYSQRLASGPTFNWVGPGEAATTACPGSPSNPEAAPGNVCLYAETVSGAGEGTDKHPSGFFGYTSDPRSGATVEFAIESEAEGYGFGSWAVTPE
jgi:hypothetical protein